MNAKLYLLGTFILFSFLSNAQTTIVLQPSQADGKDAIIDSRVNDSNYGDHPDFPSFAWTNGGEETIGRGLIDFDLSQIPENSTILSAKLSLYSYDSPANHSHSSQSGSNESVLKRIISNWDENSVTWNTQPSTTDLNQVFLPQSTSTIQDYLDINVRNLVQDMVDFPDESFGLQLSLKEEQYYRKMIFASSDNDDESLHPKLEVIFIEMITADSCITLRPDASNGKDALVDSRVSDTNYGDHSDLPSFAWTNGGIETIGRGLVDFDLSSIPENAIILSAELSLYSYDSPANQSHSSQSGSNESVLKRITSDWDENSVTWNNQPNTTNDNQVFLPQSSSSIQDYLNVDVRDLVQDMIDYPNESFGFQLSLKEEQYYRKMIFASSDNDDESLHPKLDICYTIETSTNKGIDMPTNCPFDVFPNPSNESISIKLSECFTSQKVTLEIYNLQGNLLKTINRLDFPIHQLNVSNFPKGTYFLKIIENNQQLTKKLIIQ